MTIYNKEIAGWTDTQLAPVPGDVYNLQIRSATGGSITLSNPSGCSIDPTTTQPNYSTWVVDGFTAGTAFSVDISGGGSIYGVCSTSAVKAVITFSGSTSAFTEFGVTEGDVFDIEIQSDGYDWVVDTTIGCTLSSSSGSSGDIVTVTTVNTGFFYWLVRINLPDRLSPFGLPYTSGAYGIMQWIQQPSDYGINIFNESGVITLSAVDYLPRFNMSGVVASLDPNETVTITVPGLDPTTDGWQVLVGFADGDASEVGLVKFVTYSGYFTITNFNTYNLSNYTIYNIPWLVLRT